MIIDDDVTVSAKSVLKSQRMRHTRTEDQQEKEALFTNDALDTQYLMEQICQRGNLNQAYKRVKANKGAAGIDGMTVDDLRKLFC